MNPNLQRLQPYPFERLHSLLQGLHAPSDRSPINLGIGQPQQPPPEFVLQTVERHRNEFGRYPTTAGTRQLQEACCAWAIRRFQLPEASLVPGHNLIPVNGTREALFGIAQALVGEKPAGQVAMPNPFYQIYEGATLAAGARPVYVARDPETSLPDLTTLPETTLARLELVYICSPDNPTGAVMPVHEYHRLLELADRYGFAIAADECYSEIYPEESGPPPGLLEVAAQKGRTDYHRCLVFHSLSKRSNLPGLRSGFVAGDSSLIQTFLRLRTYMGNTLPTPLQAAAAAAWGDETHVETNRNAYRERFDRVLEILKPTLGVSRPAGGFYLWPQVPGGGEWFATALYTRENLVTLPGAYLSRTITGKNPGEPHIRIALVDELTRCVEAAQRIRRVVADPG